MYGEDTNIKRRRLQWKVEFPVSQLIEACHRRLDRHTARLDHWNQELIKAQLDLKENGIDFTLLANDRGMTSYNTVGIDEKLLKRLRAVQTRVDVHVKEIDELKSHLVIFEREIANKGTFDTTTLPLSFDDVMYFRLIDPLAGDEASDYEDSEVNEDI